MWREGREIFRYLERFRERDPTRLINLTSQFYANISRSDHPNDPLFIRAVEETSWNVIAP